MQADTLHLGARAHALCPLSFSKSSFSQAMKTDESKYGYLCCSALTKAPDVLLRSKITGKVGVLPAERGDARKCRRLTQDPQSLRGDSYRFTARIRMHDPGHQHSTSECLLGLLQQVRILWNIAANRLLGPAVIDHEPRATMNGHGLQGPLGRAERFILRHLPLHFLNDQRTSAGYSVGGGRTTSPTRWSQAGSGVVGSVVKVGGVEAWQRVG